MPKRTLQTANPEIHYLALINSEGIKKKERAKKKKRKSEIHNNIEQDQDKAKNEQKLGGYDFLKL